MGGWLGGSRSFGMKTLENLPKIVLLLLSYVGIAYHVYFVCIIHSYHNDQQLLIVYYTLLAKLLVIMV